ncbi:MAG TPA: type II secretion system F family protein [Syntrophobacter fumaroxidans]|nr:type II secretion system F family protein [Syntrophobacter fumaroxidans]
MPQENIPLIAAAMAFCIACLLLLSVTLYWRHRETRKRIMEKIRQDGLELSGGEAEPAVQEITGVKRGRIIDLFSGVGKRLKTEKPSELRAQQLRFLRAGIRMENAPAVFLGAKCLGGLGLAFGFLLLKTVFFSLMSARLTAVAACATALVGFYLPDLWLRLKTSRRRKQLRRGLPDALDLMVVCVEAGMGIDSATYRVSEEMRLTNAPMSDELKYLNLELRAGKARRDALRNLALRTDLEDVNSLTTLLIQTDKFGTSVAQALRVHSDSFRTKRHQMAEELAAKLPVKLVLPLILFIFPSLFVVIMGPAMIRAFRTFMK